MRLLYSIGYGFLAWFVLHIVFLLAVVQFVMIAINGRANEELKHFSLTLLQYLWELVAFITFVRDEQPFPLGPYPKHASIRRSLIHHGVNERFCAGMKRR